MEDDYIDFEQSLLNKQYDVDSLAKQVVHDLNIVYQNHGIEHIFDRGSVLGLVEKIKQIALNEYEYMS